MELKNCFIIIPSYEPDNKLEKTIEDLTSKGIENIIVVNDGSNISFSHIFDAIKARYPNIHLLNHETNKGKGAALKTAFKFLLDNDFDYSYVITVDGDFQHKAKDVIKVAMDSEDNSDKLILGSRVFKKDSVPFKSWFGNTLTKTILRVLCYIDVTDTQTGLRCFHKKYLPEFIDKISGDRYEYETNMLIYCNEKNIGFHEVPIETIYIEENKGSHFNPVTDSFKVYRVIFHNAAFCRQMITSLLSSLLDITLFTLFNYLFIPLHNMPLNLFLSTAIARVISCLFDYFVNKIYVFKSNVDISKSLAKFSVLASVQMFLSWALLTFATWAFRLVGIGVTIVKAIVDTGLFFASYFVQKKWVFKK